MLRYFTSAVFEEGLLSYIRAAAAKKENYEPDHDEKESNAWSERNNKN